MLDFKSKLDIARKRLVQYKLMGIKPVFSRLSKEIGMDRHTLSKMYKGGEVKLTRNKPSVLDLYKEEIREILKDPAVSIAAAYFYLTDEARGDKQIKCTKSNFTKYVQKHNLNEKEEGGVAHVLFETDPGQQIQFDWVEDIKILTTFGQQIKFNLFSATLGYSRMHYFEVSFTKTETDVKRCLLHAFETFGGVTKEALTDNMSAIVSVNGKEKTVHPTIAQFFKDLNVTLRLCKTRTPQTKGKCETANKYAKWLDAYNEKITNEIDLYNLVHRLNIVVNKQINTATNRPPIALFEEEKEHLAPVNQDLLHERNNKFVNSQRVPKTLLVYYKGKNYSVNAKFVGKIVNCEEENGYLNIYYNKVIIGKHKITDKVINYTPEDYASGLMSKVETDLIDKICEENLRRFR